MSTFQLTDREVELVSRIIESPHTERLIRECMWMTTCAGHGLIEWVGSWRVTSIVSEDDIRMFRTLMSVIHSSSNLLFSVIMPAMPEMAELIVRLRGGSGRIVLHGSFHEIVLTYAEAREILSFSPIPIWLYTTAFPTLYQEETVLGIIRDAMRMGYDGPVMSIIRDSVERKVNVVL